MKAISLWQPWASLIAFQEKTIETRSWATGYRGLLVIHAAKIRTDREQVASLLNPAIRRALAAGQGTEVADFAALPFGRYVAVARLVSCARIVEDGSEIRLRNTQTDPGLLARYEARLRETDEEAFGHYADGRYAWLLDDVRPLPRPVVAAGQRQLWTPDAHHLVSIGEQIPGLTALSPRPEVPCQPVRP